MAVDKALMTGSLSMLLLQLLSEKDMYGYEIIETLEMRSNNVFSMKAGTLYPLLHGLESKGFLKSYESEMMGKIRKYYKITNKGKKELDFRKESWNEYTSAVNGIMCFEY